MDIVKRLLSELDDKTKSDIYLREIALLMEQIDELKGKIGVKENIIKSFELGVEGKKQKTDTIKKSENIINISCYICLCILN